MKKSIVILFVMLQFGLILGAKESSSNDAGYYRMDITLSNGEQYYGYFFVEL